MTDGNTPPTNHSIDDQRVLVKKRRRQRGMRLPDWVAEYLVEILIVLAVLTAIFLLVEPWDIREGLFTFIRRLTNTLSGTFGSTTRKIVNWFRSLTLSDATAFVILIIVAILAIWRTRWRMVRNAKLWSTHCPQCSSMDIQRIHRRLPERLLGLLSFPFRRYHCRECGWRGLRIYKKGYHRPVSMPQPPSDI